MIVLQITHLKHFMNCLLCTDTFDSFPVSEVSITTFTTFHIDGSLHTDFFDPEDAKRLEANGRTQLLWKDIKSYCYHIIRGKLPPLQFKLVFQLPKKELPELIAEHDLPYSPDDIFGVFVNCQYNGEKLLMTTGTSLRIFTMDKSLDHAWDQRFSDFLLRRGIDFKKL